MTKSNCSHHAINSTILVANVISWLTPVDYTEKYSYRGIIVITEIVNYNLNSLTRWLPNHCAVQDMTSRALDTHIHIQYTTTVDGTGAQRGVGV